MDRPNHNKSFENVIKISILTIRCVRGFRKGVSAIRVSVFLISGTAYDIYTYIYSYFSYGVQLNTRILEAGNNK